MQSITIDKVENGYIVTQMNRFNNHPGVINDATFVFNTLGDLYSFLVERMSLEKKEEKRE